MPKPHVVVVERDHPVEKIVESSAGGRPGENGLLPQGCPQERARMLDKDQFWPAYCCEDSSLEVGGKIS